MSDRLHALSSKRSGRSARHNRYICDPLVRKPADACALVTPAVSARAPLRDEMSRNDVTDAPVFAAPTQSSSPDGPVWVATTLLKALANRGKAALGVADSGALI